MQTPFNRNSILIGSLFLLLSFCVNLAGQAQNCLAYEKELEEYFISHQLGEKINFRYLERTRWKCDYPTPKLDLIYYYFKAIGVLGNSGYPSQDAYEAATRYYDECATNFPYLLKESSSSRFTNMFFDRAENLESRLALVANQLNYYPEDRKYGQLADGSWVKRGGDDPQNLQTARRISSPSNTDFVKKFYHKGKYVNKRQNPVFNGPTRGNNGEFYGYVGDLTELNPVSYFRWMRSQQRDYTLNTERQPQEVGTRGMNRRVAPVREESMHSPYGDDWVTELSSAFQPMLSIYHNQSILTKPGKDGEELDMIKFGEVVARLAGDSPIMKDGEGFIQIRNRTGVVGWVKEKNMVADGKIAVFTGATSGYMSLTSRLDRNGVIFQKGELIILEAVRDDWVRVVTRNEEKRGWVYGIETLSIDPNDVEIAELIHSAYQDPSSYGRLVKLESIKLIPGFENSELAPFVLEKIIETEQRGGFSFK